MEVFSGRRLHSAAIPSSSALRAPLVPVIDGLALLLAGIGSLGGIAWLLAGAYVLTEAATGGYRPRLDLDLGRDVPRVLGHACLVTVVVGVLLHDDPEALAPLMRSAPVAGAALILGRLVAHQLVRRRRAAATPQPVVVIGAGHVGVSIVELLRQHPSFGLHPVGFVDEGVSDGAAVPVPILGAIADLPRIVSEHGVRHVIVAFGRTREVDLVAVLRATEQDDIEIHLVPRLFELGASPSADRLGGIPLVRLHRTAMRSSAWWTKRAFDIVLTTAALTLLLPVLALVALLVRWSSPGPILFKQRRVGQHGRPFDILKFRTMEVNDDCDSTWSVRSDPRVTPVGRLLRRSSLDELPQLINVLRGDMSLVGPRPERPAFDAQYRSSVPRYGDRLRVPVGLTGLAQVEGLRGDTSIAERVWFDNRYIEDWSLWQDVTILVRTLIAVVREPERGSRPDDELALYRAMREHGQVVDIRAQTFLGDAGAFAGPVEVGAAVPVEAGAV